MGYGGKMKKHWYSVDKDEQLVEWLEDNFSLHDADMIYNLLQEFRAIDTKQGEITFEDFLNNKQKEIENG